MLYLCLNKAVQQNFLISGFFGGEKRKVVHIIYTYELEFRPYRDYAKLLL